MRFGDGVVVGGEKWLESVKSGRGRENPENPDQIPVHPDTRSKIRPSWSKKVSENLPIWGRDRPRKHPEIAIFNPQLSTIPTSTNTQSGQAGLN